MDHNETNTISQDITFFANRDKDSYSFYDLINPFLYSSNQKDLYQLVQNQNDIVTLSDEKPFPNIIYNAITPFTNRVYFGLLPMLSKFYCIIDNSVYFWATDSDNCNNEFVDFYVEEESTMISCVSCGLINPNVFDEKEVVGVIIYGTDILVKIIPVTRKVICFELSISVKLKFIPTAFYTNKNGTIFVSSDEGDIYSLIYTLGENTPKCNFTIKNLTRNRFLRFLPTILFTSSPIMQMVIDEETQILAALNRDSVLKFYKIDGDNMIFLYKFDPHEFEGIYTNSIQFITNVPLNCSSSIKFVGFYQDGTRICFFVDRFLDLVYISTVYFPPPITTGDVFFSAFISPSYCIFLYEKSIVIARENHKANEPNCITKESYCVIPFDSDILSFSQMIPNFQPTKLVNHPFFWPHLFSPSPAYLITSTGTRALNFLTPVDSLLKIMEEEEKSRIFMSEPLKDFASIDFYESTSTALLLAAKQPKVKDRCLHFVIKVIQDAEENRKELDPHYLASYTFFIRINRILSPIWSFPLFQMKNENEYDFCEGFKNPPLDYVKEIRSVKSLCDDYYKLFGQLNQPKTVDIDRFPSISVFLSNLIGILRYIKIISKIDKKEISEILTKIDMKYQSRLVASEFGYGSQNSDASQNIQCIQFSQQLSDSLHEFAMKLYDISPQSDILNVIEQKCPQFFDRSDIIVLDSIRIINEKVDNSDGAITRAVDSLVHHISRPMDHDNICKTLKSKGCFGDAFKLCMAKADSVDSKRLAYHWFIFDRTITDSPGRDEFDLRYKYYEIIFNIVDLDCDDDINSVLKTDDEMFHICFYRNLLEDDKLIKIVSKKTPYLKKFIQNEAREFLWCYLVAHKKYNKAAMELWRYISYNDEIEIGERIELLKKGILYSFEVNTLKNEFKTLTRLGEIQLELLERTNEVDNYGYCILEPRDLFIECSSLQHWDLSLRVLSFSSFRTEKKFPISQIWQNFLVQNLFGMSLMDSNASLRRLFSFLDINSDVAKLEIIVPLLENFKLNKKGQKYWAFQLLIEVGYNLSNLAKIYYNLINDGFIEKEVKYTFIDIFALAISKGAFYNKNKVLSLKSWFFENAQGYDDYEDVLRYFCAIL